MSEAIQEKPFWLSGNFAPTLEERTETELAVTGQIPEELSGRYLRNGANPKNGDTPHWFLGNGMIHGVELNGGKANWYRNRYVQTPLGERRHQSIGSLARHELNLWPTRTSSATLGKSSRWKKVIGPMS